ncbi:MAG: hypothetical protein ACI4VQ_06225 [Clostridia bacterium]
MSSSNKRAKQRLIELYGEECFIDKLHLRKGNNKKYKSNGQRKRMKQLTYHHIIKKENGGKATVENGALLSAENHEWFNQQSPIEQARLNNIFQQYKMGILEINNGKIINSEIIHINSTKEEYITIPLEPDDRQYNRAKIKRETQKMIDRYYKREDR